MSDAKRATDGESPSVDLYSPLYFTFHHAGGFSRSFASNAMGSSGALQPTSTPGPRPTVRNATQCTLRIRSYAARSNPRLSIFSFQIANAFVLLAFE